MSMWKPLVQTATAVLMISLMGASVGCKKDSKFKVPDIKMITIDNVHVVNAVDDNNIWIANNIGTIFHSGDGGTTWLEQANPAAESKTLLTGSEFLDSRTGWMTGLYGTMLHTTDGGTTWQRQDTGTEYHLFSVDFVDAQNGWAIGEWNTILRTTDGGTTWQRMTKVRDLVLSSIAMGDMLHGWVVGEAGLIGHTSDGGATWQRQMPKAFERATFEEEFENPRPSLFCVQAIDANTAYMCGLDATIMRTTDGGQTWEFLPTESQFPLYTLKIKNGKGWAVGNKGATLVSDDNGDTWNLKQGLIKSKMWFRDVSFSSPNKGWVVGQAGVVSSTNDGGATWQFHSGLSYDMDFFEMPRALEFRGLPTWGPFARQ
jgi:photosystem II stability/assembly factor-like uncharacterized protein